MRNQLEYKEAETGIQVAHRIRNGQDRAMVVQFDSVATRNKVLGCKTNLKNKKNDKGRKMYTSEQLPEILTEKKRHNTSIIQELKKKPISLQPPVFFKNGVLQVDGEDYASKINPPTVRRILTLSDWERDFLSRVQLATTQKIKEKGSTFTEVTLNI